MSAALRADGLPHLHASPPPPPLLARYVYLSPWRVMSPDKGRNGHLRAAVDVDLRADCVGRRQRIFIYENHLPLSSDISSSCLALLRFCIAHSLAPNTLRVFSFLFFCLSLLRRFSSECVNRECLFESASFLTAAGMVDSSFSDVIFNKM